MLLRCVGKLSRSPSRALSNRDLNLHQFISYGFLEVSSGCHDLCLHFFLGRAGLL